MYLSDRSRFDRLVADARAFPFCNKGGSQNACRTARNARNTLGPFGPDPAPPWWTSTKATARSLHFGATQSQRRGARQLDLNLTLEQPGGFLVILVGLRTYPYPTPIQTLSAGR